jgi:Xaa-Pro aminopeptidase
VDGTFSPRQREIYQIVLDAQKAAEALVRQGATWDQLNAAAEDVIARGLAELGLIDAPDATYRCESPRFGVICPQYRLYFMHGSATASASTSTTRRPSYFGPFVAGSIFTIEPGIYVRADALDHLPDTPENRAMAERLRPVLERYANIGVRLEDNYLVTGDGFERLSAGAPREMDEVEALMREPAGSARPGTRTSWSGTARPNGANAPRWSTRAAGSPRWRSTGRSTPSSARRTSSRGVTPPPTTSYSPSREAASSPT